MVPRHPAHSGHDAHLHASNPGASPESANIAATFFALLLLAMTSAQSPSAAFARVNRKATLRWLKTLQRPDGSFGEVVDADGIISGGRDMRYCYFASAIRWCLRDPDATHDQHDAALDFDTDRLVQYIRAGQTFEGGVGETTTHESHSGYAYCAVAALSLLDRPAEGPAVHPSKILRVGVDDLDALIKFCVSRKFAYLEPSCSTHGAEGAAVYKEDAREDDANFYLPENLADLSLDKNLVHIAFNGRCNKAADCCYMWWTGGAMALLSKLQVLKPSIPAARTFLLEKMQHLIGGFSKHPGSPPDVYHAYLGLASLATLDRAAGDLPALDEALCVSEATIKIVVAARAAMLEKEKEVKHGKSLAAGLEQLSKLMAEKEDDTRAERAAASAA